MGVIRPALRFLLRWRYVALAAWSVPWLVIPFRAVSGGLTDWLVVEFGARTLMHYDAHYAGGTFHLYANHPEVQIGPPSLWLVAAFQWASPHLVAWLFAALMVGCGLAAIAACEATARHLLPGRDDRVAALAFLGGLIVTATWATGIGRYRHLDDVLAITAIALATLLVARRRPWWLAGLTVGCAVASKPWAIAAAPLLYGLPRTERARSALVAIGACAAWWLPFVVVDHRTVSALGDYRLGVSDVSALHALGVSSGLAPNWVRPIQFIVGFGVALLVARRGRWLAAPIAGIAIRVLVDPQTWPYYGMGPVLFALALDLADGRRRLPLWTMVTAAVEYGADPLLPGAGGYLRVAWVVLTLWLVLWPNRLGPEPLRVGHDIPTPAAALVPASA